MSTDFLQNIRRVWGSAPGPLDERISRPGHPLDGCPAQALLGISEASGLQWYANDFLVWEGPTTGVSVSTGGWLIGDTGTGVVGAQTAGDGYGVLSIASGGTEDDSTVLQLVGEPWRFISGKRMWCFARIACDDIDDNELAWGLFPTSAVTVDTNAELIALVDGFFFSKAETATTFTFSARKDGAATTIESCATLTADNGFIVLGFTILADGSIEVWSGTTIHNMTLAGTVGAGNANIPDDVELSLYFNAEAGDNAAATLLVDWVVVAQER